MSSLTDPQPDPVTDEIVAYLDGELAPQDSRRVESRLATDEEFRQELNELDRAWDALDALPAATVDDNYDGPGEGIDLDDGLKTNYPKLGAALKRIPGLEKTE